MKKRQILAIAAGSATMLLSGVTAFAAPSTYTVHSGDSLYTISHRYHVSEKNLVAWNHIQNPNRIYVHQTLRLTALKSSGHAESKSTTHVKSRTTQVKSKTTSPTKTYTVKGGDCLSVIAKRYHVTVSQLAAWNHIHNLSHIVVGQKLTIHPGSTSTAKSSKTSKTSSGSPSVKTSTSHKLSSRADTLSSASSTSGQAIVDYAKQFIGDKYRWGGESTSGFDCSGLVQVVYRHFGVSLPRVAADQATVGQVISKSSLKPGDLVFFNTTGSTFSHVGIYTGNNEFLSATDHGVMISSLSNPYWGPRFTRATNPLG